MSNSFKKKNIYQSNDQLDNEQMQEAKAIHKCEDLMH